MYFFCVVRITNIMGPKIMRLSGLAQPQRAMS